MLEIETEFDAASEATIHVAGQLDMSSSDDLRTVLLDAADQRFERVVVDLEDVELIDSSGIATLVEGLQKMRDHGGTLVLKNLSDSVRSVFEIANLLEVFTVE